MNRKPTRAQENLIHFFAGTREPWPGVRVTQATYRVCREQGWIVEIEEHPYHRTTMAGRVAVGLPIQPAPEVVKLPTRATNVAEMKAKEAYAQEWTKAQASAPTMRVISTGAIPDRHIAASNGAHLLGPLLCGYLMGGTYVGEDVDEDLVDCLGCLDGYAERLRVARGLPPVVNGDAGLSG